MKKKHDANSRVPEKREYRITLFFILCFIVTVIFPGTIKANNLFPQDRETITGVVTDTKGIPLPGTTVLLAGTSTGVATDNEGNFTLRLNIPRGTLIFSCVGYKTAKVPFEIGKTLSVRLEEEVSELNEVKVVAYGTQTKREAVGAMSVVKSEDLKDIPSPSVAGLLQGRVAGMDVVNMTGAPGSGGVAISIRGFNSLSVENGRRGSEPLWVIDGIPMYSFTSPVTGLNTLSEIDPKDIESVSVLKDAASASIYGSRAANGVILVTTKKGRLNQKARFSANVSQTFSFNPALPDLTGGNAERNLRLEALNNYRETFYDYETNTYRYPVSLKEAWENGVAYGYFWGYGSGASVDALQDSLNPFYNHSTNLFDYYFRTGKVTDANLQLSGGTDKVAYSIGLGYYTETGVLKNTGFNRVKLLSNLFIKPFPKMDGNLRFYIARTGRNRAGKGHDIFNFAQAGDIETLPDELMNTSTLLPGPGTAVFDEITRRFNETKEKSESYRLRTSFDLAYEFLPGLQLKSSVALDYSQQNQNIFQPSDLDEYGQTYSSGQVGRNLMLLNENLLTYKQTFNDKHTVNVLAGLSFQTDEMNSVGGYGRKAASNLIHYVSWTGNAFDIDNNRQLKEFTTDFAKSTMVGLFTRLEYNYRQKYLASVTVRRDASSKFGEKTRWGTFPSYALAYTFSEEPFMDWSRSALDYGKLRISYGKSGRQFEDPYLSAGILEPGKIPFLGNPTVEPEWFYGLLNRQLSWEETKQFDAGLDLEFFNHRIGITLDYYNRITDKLLYTVRLPGNYNGYMNQWRNAYSIGNSGVELQIKADIIRNEKFNWNLTVNFARNWNKLRKSENGKDFLNGQLYDNISIIGKPLNGIYAFKNNGFYQNSGEIYYSYQDGEKRPLGTHNQIFLPGDRVILDADGNGEISSMPPLMEDRVYCGSPLPIGQGGIINTLEWKGFDLNILFNYSLGRHILNAGRGASVGTVLTANPSEMVRPVFADLSQITFWQKPGDNADFPVNRLESGLGNFATNLSSNVEKVNYLKLKTLTLGYTLPENVKNVLGFSARIFLSAENLFTITNYSGTDPESVDVVTGIDNYNNYPLSKRVTVGLTLDF